MVKIDARVCNDKGKIVEWTIGASMDNRVEYSGGGIDGQRASVEGQGKGKEKIASHKILGKKCSLDASQFLRNMATWFIGVVVT